MKLYYHPASPFARKAQIVAEMLGLDLELEFVDLFNGGGQKPAFLKLNPQGKVPTLVDGDFVLWESNAIVQHFAAKAPASPLFPDDPSVRADILRWQFWESTSIAPACMIYVYENLLKEIMNSGAPDAMELQKGEEKFQRSARMLDAHLAKREWLLGETLTLADLSVAPLLMYADAANYPIQPYPHIAAWFTKIQALPAWQRTEPAQA